MGLILLGCSDGTAPKKTTPPPPPIPASNCLVAHNAAEAWPSRPSELPKLTHEEVVQACSAYLACKPPDVEDPYSLNEWVTALEGIAEWSIPIIGYPVARPVTAGFPLTVYSERVEFFVSCVESGADCEAIRHCLTPLPGDFGCTDEGCWSERPYKVTCNGTIATITSGSNSFQRDCARAYATCDPTSPTGCTDRPLSCCPTVGTLTRCDGDISLHCDAFGSVRYHDCSRLGGTCRASANEDLLSCDYGTGTTSATNSNSSSPRAR